MNVLTMIWRKILCVLEDWNNPCGFEIVDDHCYQDSPLIACLDEEANLREQLAAAITRAEFHQQKYHEATLEIEAKDVEISRLENKVLILFVALLLVLLAIVFVVVLL